MLNVAVVIQSIFLLLTPIVIGFWFNRRWGLPWGLFLGGALAYVAAWVATSLIPLPGVASLILSAISQMGILYLIYRLQLKITTEREALMVGLGQGGIELILISGLLGLLFLAQMVSLRDASDETLIDIIAQREGITEEEVEPEDLDDLREFVDDFWSQPWYAPLAQAIPPLTLLPIQAALAIIVLGAWTHDTPLPLVGAMALHFLSRYLPIRAGKYGGVPAWLAMSLLLGGIAIWFLNRLWPDIQHQVATARKARRKPKS